MQGRRAIHSPGGQTHVKPCEAEKEGDRGGTMGFPTLFGAGSRPQDCAARTGEEAGLDEEGHDPALDHGSAVEPLDRQPLRATALHMCDQRSKRRA